MTSEEKRVLIEHHSNVRTLILNRPRQLNALSSNMVSQLMKLFLEFEEDSDVALVILKGKGRGFCAGGDVAAVARETTEGHWRFGANIFWDEYNLNYIMATFRKLQVSLLDGIVMGGGCGISMHGRFRVATENTVLAMPETALGLFPDVGASHFLFRLPGFLGEYAGLTGARLNYADLIGCGLATHFVPSLKLPLLEAALYEVNASDPMVVGAIINKYSESPPRKDSAFDQLETINRYFSKSTVEEILCALEGENLNRSDEWVSSTIQSLRKASPLSLKITLRLIRDGRLLRIDQCMSLEYRISCHILRKKHSADFFEGCRAILVDKDKNPKGFEPEPSPVIMRAGALQVEQVGPAYHCHMQWQPSKLEEVTEEMVNDYFSKVDDDEWKELEFSSRPRDTAYGRSNL